MTYQLMFCCRNENGLYHEAGIDEFCFYVNRDMVLAIESASMPPKRIKWKMLNYGKSFPSEIKIGRVILPASNHKTHVGNIHWDMIDTTAAGLAKLASYLYRSDNWRMDQGPERL